MAFDLAGMLQQYLGGATGQSTDKAAEHFDQAAAHAPKEQVSAGLADAFRSDQTPPFGEMVGKMFGQADPQQKTGMVQQLLSSLGPSALAALGGSGILGRLLGHGGSTTPTTISPDKVEQMTPEQVQEIAAHAEQQNPGVVDKMSSFYAQHPGLVKGLGGAALAIVLGKIANRNKG